MSRLLCDECANGMHSQCSGDFSTTTVMTCTCIDCKRWLDDHGPFAEVPNAGAMEFRNWMAART